MKIHPIVLLSFVMLVTILFHVQQHASSRGKVTDTTNAHAAGRAIGRNHSSRRDSGGADGHAPTDEALCRQRFELHVVPPEERDRPASRHVHRCCSGLSGVVAAGAACHHAGRPRAELLHAQLQTEYARHWEADRLSPFSTWRHEPLEGFMANPLLQESWSPYAVGVGIGMLSWFSFASVDHPLGISTAFEQSAALTVKAAAPTIGARASTSQAEKRQENHRRSIGSGCS